MIGFELLGGFERGSKPRGRERREERRRDRRIDLDAADVQTILAAAVDDVLAGAMIPGRGVSAAVMHGQAASAVSACGDSLQQRCTFSHGASAVMRTWPDVLGETLLVGLEGLPVDEAFVMVADEDGPFRARAQFEALAQASALIDVTGLLRSAIHVDAGVERVGEDLMDFGVSGRDPAHILKRVRVQREAQALRAEPQPHAPRRAHLGKALEDGADRGGDRLIRMQQHFTVRFATHETDRQSSMQLAARRLVADAAEQSRAQNMQFRFGHRALQPQHQTIVEQARMINPVGIADEGVGCAAQIEQAIPVGVVARQARDFQSQHDADLTERHFSGHAREARTLGEPPNRRHRGLHRTL